MIQFATDFSTDTHPYYDYGDGSPGYPLLSYWPYFGTVASNGWRTSDSRICKAQGVSVYAGLGKGGSKNGLWCANNPSTVDSYDSSSWWYLNNNDAVPIDYAAGATIRFSIKYLTEAFETEPISGYTPDSFCLVAVHPFSGQELTFTLWNNGTALHQQWVYYLAWESASISSDTYAEVAAGTDWHTFVDGQWHDIVVTYKPSTVTGWSAVTGASVANDGWIHVTDNGTTLIEANLIDFCMNHHGLARTGVSPAQDNINRPDQITVGWSLAGIYDNISFGTLEPTITSTAGGVSFAQISVQFNPPELPIVLDPFQTVAIINTGPQWEVVYTTPS